MPPRPAVIAFDIIGTVFSLETLRQDLSALGLLDGSLELWFAETLRNAFAMAATSSFAPFRSIFECTLDDFVARRGLTIDPEEKRRLLERFGDLPAYPDARDAFQLLHESGIRIVALSNGAAATSERLLRNADIRDFVEDVISVDELRLFKPRKEIYLHAAKRGGVSPNQMALIATHAWDIHGAKCAGLLAGFVARGQIFPSVMQGPDIVGETLVETARQFVKS